MKTRIFSLSLPGLLLAFFALLLIPSGCNQAKVSSITGTWKLIAFEGNSNDGSVNFKYPGNIEMFDQLFIYSDGYFVFSGRYKMASDSVFSNNYGGGSFTYDGDDYVETIMYFPNAGYIGKSLKYDLEIRGDTLIKIGPADAGEDFWGTLREVYIRNN